MINIGYVQKTFFQDSLLLSNGDNKKMILYSVFCDGVIR